MSDNSQTPSFKIGSWFATPALNLLERDGRSIGIEPRAMDVLAYLAARPGEVVSISELIEVIWQNNVTDGSVYRVINQLRHIFEDKNGKPRYIQTVPKRGYRLVAEVRFQSEQLGPFGKRQHISRRGVPRLVLGPSYIFAASVVLIILGVVAFRGTSSEPQIRDTDPNVIASSLTAPNPVSIAVLPFDNLSPDPDNAFIATGIHVSLIDELTRINALTVISRPSVLRYADGQTPIQQIADELNVETIMKGTVLYAENRIRIVTQLIDPRTEVNIWSETYDQDFSDYFEIQADLASNIAMALEAELLPSERQSIERRPTESPVAYSLYLKSFLTATNVESLHLLDQALKLDPRFALAHVWKARRLVIDLLTDDEDTLIETERLVQEHAERALELDPNLGYAHVALAELHSRHWREAEALAAFEQAIQLSPNDVEVLLSFSFFDDERGQNQQAIEKARAAVLLDPNNLRTHLRLGGAYLFSKDPNLAASVDLDFINRFPPDPWLYLALAYFELIRGDDSEALVNISIAEELMGDSRQAGFLARLAYAYSRVGRLDDASRVLGELEALGSSGQRIGPAQFGFANLAAGNLEESLAWFNTAADTRHTPSGGNWITAVVKQNTFSDPLLDQPEWVGVRNRLGFR